MTEKIPMVAGLGKTVYVLPPHKLGVPEVSAKVTS
jgi:hypothetical protein